MSVSVCVYVCMYVCMYVCVCVYASVCQIPLACALPHQPAEGNRVEHVAMVFRFAVLSPQLDSSGARRWGSLAGEKLVEAGRFEETRDVFLFA